MELGQADLMAAWRVWGPSHFLVGFVSPHLEIPSVPIEEETVNHFRKQGLASLSC